MLDQFCYILGLVLYQQILSEKISGLTLNK